MSALPRLSAPLLLLALAACANSGSPNAAELGPFAEEPAPPPSLDEPGRPAPAAEGIAQEDAAMTCNAEPLAWTIGQVADEALVARAREESGSRSVRLIRPGMAVTMDYREDRLNLELDEQGVVKRAYCS